MPNNQQKEEWCGWCIRHPRAIANSGYEQQNTSGEWKGLCKRCASRRLNNPYNALLNIRKSLMPNNEQKEEAKCYCCCHLKGTGKVCTHPFGHIMKCRHCEHCVEKPEPIVTTLEEDRKFLAEKWEERISCGECFDYRVRPCPNCIGHHRFISRLLTAKERVVRAECAEIVRKYDVINYPGGIDSEKVANEILNNDKNHEECPGCGADETQTCPYNCPENS